MRYTISVDAKLSFTIDYDSDHDDQLEVEESDISTAIKTGDCDMLHDYLYEACMADEERFLDAMMQNRFAIDKLELKVERRPDHKLEGGAPRAPKGRTMPIITKK